MKKYIISNHEKRKVFLVDSLYIENRPILEELQIKGIVNVCTDPRTGSE